MNGLADPARDRELRSRIHGKYALNAL